MRKVTTREADFPSRSGAGPTVTTRGGGVAHSTEGARAGSGARGQQGAP